MGVIAPGQGLSRPSTAAEAALSRALNDELAAKLSILALPILCAGLLTASDVVLRNVPALQDVSTMLKLLKQMGLQVTQEDGVVTLNGANIDKLEAPYDMVKTMRASILVLGPLLARFGEAKVSLPGGCAIGSRPVDQHIKGLQAMGAEITIEAGYIHAKAKRLRGARIVTDMITVTGTENLLMAATLADGETILENAAQEPEIPDLAEMLIITAPDISNSILQRNFGKVSVEHAALSQSPEHLNPLLEHLLDENSVGETVKLLWVTPARRVLSSTLLNRCLASDSPAVALAAARHIVRADLRGRIRDDGKCSLTRLAASDDQELRYTALSLLTELRDANDNDHGGLVLHETADSDTQFLQHLIVKSPEYCDESIARALASDNCWIALRSADVLVRFAASDRSSRKTLEHFVDNSSDLFILDHIAGALPKEDPLQRVIRMKR